MSEKLKQIKITKQPDGSLLVYKNETFKLIIDVCKVFYNNVISDFEKVIGQKYLEKDEFKKLIINIFSENKKSVLSVEDAIILQTWIHLICKMILEKETTDLKNKELQSFFKETSKLNKKITKLLNKEPLT